MAQVVKNLPIILQSQVQSPGEGNGYPLQYACLETPLDRGAWRAIVHGVTKELGITE